jgi:hypothetical protein
MFGVNLEQMIPWGRSRTFIDLVKTSPGFDTLAHPGDHAAPVGADGWPTSDFGVVLVQGAPQTMSGAYTIVFQGQAILTASNGAKVTNSAYNPATNTTTATLTWNAAIDSLSVFCKQTTAPRHIQVLRRGHTQAQAANQIFSNEFLNLLTTLNPGIIRAMDALETNNTKVVNWAGRSTPATPSYNTTARPNAPGMPYEYLVQLCNTINCDLWLNVPVTASDDYRQQLAALVAQQLNPGLFVYLEYGNEVWNSALGSYAPNMAAAQAQRAALGFDSQPVIAGWQRTANECIRLGQVFQAAMPAPPGRVRPVLAGQGVNLGTFQSGWKYLTAHYPSPASLIYGMAIAPYSPLTPDLPLNDWRVLLLASPHVAAFISLCSGFGVNSCCYECGSDLSDPTLIATQQQPGMQQVMYQYYSTWRGTGPLVHYNVCGETKRAYGLTPDAVNLTAPKFLAAQKFSAQQ